ncbi:MAG: hypothetical protein K5917_01310 [Clostridiales bacterium]|nr:hypothetical protein [Clostridiales bacterium]
MKNKIFKKILAMVLSVLSLISILSVSANVFAEASFEQSLKQKGIPDS